MVFLFPFLPCADRILKAFVAAQVMALALKADGRPPALPGLQPIHAWHAAGVAAPDRLGPQHLHTGSVHIGESGQLGAGQLLFPSAAAASGVSAPQAVGLHHYQLSAVALAFPGSPAASVLRGFQYRQFPVPLAGQVQFPS